LIREIASKHGYQVEESPQTIYPDFTLLKSQKDKNKIAIDIKTTYRRGANKSFVYTLGSYTSFLRNK
jgi:flavorubredoxin